MSLLNDFLKEPTHWSDCESAYTVHAGFFFIYFFLSVNVDNNGKKKKELCLVQRAQKLHECCSPQSFAACTVARQLFICLDERLLCDLLHV